MASNSNNVPRPTLEEVKKRIASSSKEELAEVLKKVDEKAQEVKARLSYKSPQQARKEAELLNKPFEIVK